MARHEEEPRPVALRSQQQGLLLQRLLQRPPDPIQRLLLPLSRLRRHLHHQRRRHKLLRLKDRDCSARWLALLREWACIPSVTSNPHTNAFIVVSL